MKKGEMKKACVVGGLIGASLTQSYAGAYEHIVVKGDIFSKIVEDYSRTQPSLDYKQSLKLIRDLNKSRLGNFDLIKPGDKVRLPSNDEIHQYLTGQNIAEEVAVIKDTEEMVNTPIKFVTSRTPASTVKSDIYSSEYRIQKNDTLGGIAREVAKVKYKGLITSKQALKLIMDKNDDINNPHEIYQEQVIKLPAFSDVMAVIDNKKEDDNKVANETETKVVTKQASESSFEMDAYQERMKKIESIEKKLAQLKEKLFPENNSEQNLKTKEDYDFESKDAVVLSRFYKVRPGDSLGSIVAKFTVGKSYKEKEDFKRALIEVNELKDEHLIFVGNKLYFPLGWDDTRSPASINKN